MADDGTTADPVAPYLHCECGTRLVSGERCPLCGWGWNDTLSAESDPVAARLAEIRERAREVSADGLGISASYDLARTDAPALLGAVEAALKFHHDSWGRCAQCRNPDGGLQAWPCGEYVTIRAKLLGEAVQ